PESRRTEQTDVGLHTGCSRTDRCSYERLRARRTSVSVRGVEAQSRAANRATANRQLPGRLLCRESRCPPMSRLGELGHHAVAPWQADARPELKRQAT